MKQMDDIEVKDELNKLSSSVKKYIENGEYENAQKIICEAMCEYPDAPQPHNLFGILMEEEGNHVRAMKHFRASWDLDPTYLPARHNLMDYGTFCSHPKKFAYSEIDC